MSAFHRVDDVRTMPALRFINFALRLAAYKGVIRALAEADAYEREKGNLPASARSSGSSPAPRSSGDIRGNRTVDSDATTLRTDPAFAGMIEVR